MTLDEFDALKVGDKVRNTQGHEAEVIASGPYGHKIVWKGTAVPYTMYRAGRMWVGFEAVPAEMFVRPGNIVPPEPAAET